MNTPAEGRTLEAVVHAEMSQDVNNRKIKFLLKILWQISWKKKKLLMVPTKKQQETFCYFRPIFEKMHTGISHFQRKRYGKGFVSAFMYDTV